MPEGPSIVILKEQVQFALGEIILNATGNASIEKTALINSRITGIKSWGKHFIIETSALALRIHFLMFGSYSINEQTKPDKSLRLALFLKNGALYFYTCSVKYLPGKPDDIYDWEADVMSEYWNPAKARKKLTGLKQTMVCDALLNQEIFAGVGNIIKNEVLYRLALHPESLIEHIPAGKISQLLGETRTYCFQFLHWKKKYELKKHWLAHARKTCEKCNLPFIKKYCGKTQRRSFICENCQVKY